MIGHDARPSGMPDILELLTTDLLASESGVASLRALRAAGIPDRTSRGMLRRGELHRVREGVVALPSCPPDVLTAARLGGRLAGASAARHLGLWTPPTRRLVIEVPRGTHVAPTPGVVVLRGPAGPRRFRCSSLAELVPQILRTEPVPMAIAVLDSMLRRTSLSRFDLEDAARDLPHRLRALLELVDDRAESGTESVVRVGLRRAGIVATPQVRLPFHDLERADLGIGDRLLIECDSRDHHSTPEQLDRDDARDLELMALGFVVVRVRYRAAMENLDGVVAAISRLVELGVHLDRSAPDRRDTPSR